MDFAKQIKEYIELEIKVLRKLDQNEINNAMRLLEETRDSGSNIYVFGNGGSAMTATHMENYFNNVI